MRGASEHDALAHAEQPPRVGRGGQPAMKRRRVGFGEFIIGPFKFTPKGHPRTSWRAKCMLPEHLVPGSK
eukprot:4883999-Alexandrium_andersonii.AAC.1